MAMLALVSLLHVAGCTLPGASGIAANIYAESGGNPLARGSGLGLYQVVGPRKRRMLAALGARWTDARAQIGYMLAELREYGLYEITCLASDPGVSARIFMLDFERPAARDPSYRVGLARWIYGQAARRTYEEIDHAYRVANGLEHEVR